MLQHGPFKPGGLYSRLGVILLILVVAIGGGLWLGERSVEQEAVVVQEKPTPPKPPSQPPKEQDKPVPPPIFFQVAFPSGAARTAVVEEVTMAASAGVHQYILAVPLPWQGDLKASLEVIQLLFATDPDAKAFLYVNLDPPPSWAAAHPNDISKTNGKPNGFASLASESWRSDAHTALEALVTTIATSVPPEKIIGYVLGALENGTWHLDGGYDTSDANHAGFRRWLKTRYKDDAELFAAWGETTSTLETALIPKEIDNAKEPGTFLDIPAMQNTADFLEYSAKIAADTITAFAGYVKAAGKDLEVMVPYGFSFELIDNDQAHLALSLLMKSPNIDGFIGGLSSSDRGLGGVGGFAGPVDSAAVNHKQWFLVDDTRTGFAWNPATGSVERPKNVRVEDIYNVQERNFAMAAAHGLGLVWSDADGTGACHDPEMWRHFGKMVEIYGDIKQRGDKDGSAAGYPINPVIAVVVDEGSRFLQCDERNINRILLNEVRDAVLHAAVPARFYLLDDMLGENPPGAPVYLFLNAFRLTPEQREQLQGLLARNKAAAIWMYAPGYFDKASAVENISATVKMTVKQFDEPAKTGSQYLLGGRWLKKDELFGYADTLEPLFYIDDPQTNVIAQFADSGKPSIAATFFEEGWGSIFCAEPWLTTEMLRELLGILEIHQFYQPTPQRFEDGVYFGPNLMVIHAKETGERSIDLGRICNVQDLLAPEIGWQRKRTYALPLKTGDTRMLRITPVEQDEK